MNAKLTIYRDTVVVYASRNKVSLRISTGVRATKLLQSGLLPKSIDDWDEKNKQIRKVLKDVQELIDEYPSLTPTEISYLYKTGRLPNQEQTKELTFVDVIRMFIKASKKGERRTAKGRKPSKGSIKNYEMVLSKLLQFREYTKYDLDDWSKVNDRFYSKYCDWCWDKLENYDGTLGRDIVFFRTVIRWMGNMELTPHKINLTNWNVFKEESSDESFLIFYEDEIKLLSDMKINLTEKNELYHTSGARMRKKVERRLGEIRDCALMGIFTCFRISDLMSLTEENLHVTPTGWFLHKGQEKTKNYVRVPLFDKGIEIIQKYRGRYPTLLPKFSDMVFNSNLKRLGLYFKEHVKELEELGLMHGKVYNDWESFTRVRTRRSMHDPKMIATKDALSSHTLRKSGISFLLSKGLSENEVKKISGHKYDSESFYKYIKIAEQVKNKKHLDAWSTVFN